MGRCLLTHSLHEAVRWFVNLDVMFLGDMTVNEASHPKRFLQEKNKIIRMSRWFRETPRSK